MEPVRDWLRLADCGSPARQIGESRPEHIFGRIPLLHRCGHPHAGVAQRAVTLWPYHVQSLLMAASHVSQSLRYANISRTTTD